VTTPDNVALTPVERAVVKAVVAALVRSGSIDLRSSDKQNRREESDGR
jgi:hypothetical protein